VTGLEHSIALIVFRVAAAIALLLAAIFVIWRRPIVHAVGSVRRDFAALPRPRFSLALVLITGFGALLRILELQRPMGNDESATFLYYASKPLLLALTIYGSPNNHLLHTALMHMSSALFGDAEWALRLPAFIAGVAMIPLTYFTVVSCQLSVVPTTDNRQPTTHGALIAAALTASWPALIDYSTDGRGYTLLCCFTLIAAAAMALVVRSGNSAAVVIFAIASALGFYTVPVMLYPFVMLVAWGLTSLQRRRVAIAAIGTIFLTAILYAPVIVVSGIDALLSNPYVKPMSISAFTQSLPQYVLAVWKSMTVSVPLIIQALIAVALLRKRVAQAILPALAAVVIVLALQRVLPFPRVWLPLLPLVFICAAAWPWTRRSEVALATAIVISLGLIAFGKPRLRETGELRAVHSIVRELNHRAHPGDAILALPPSEMPLAFYAPNLRREILNPDWHRARRVFVIENRDYGQTLEKTLAFFQIRGNARLLRDFGSSALYEVWRPSSAASRHLLSPLTRGEGSRVRAAPGEGTQQTFLSIARPHSSTSRQPQRNAFRSRPRMVSMRVVISSSSASLRTASDFQRVILNPLKSSFTSLRENPSCLAYVITVRRSSASSSKIRWPDRRVAGVNKPMLS
jgi:hypothetical protein